MFFLKNGGDRYNKLMGLLIITRRGLILSQEDIKKGVNKDNGWERDNMGAYYSIINDLRLTDKEVLESTSERIHQHTCMFKIKIVFPRFVYCTSGHCFSKSSLHLGLISVFTLWNSENKKAYSAQMRLHCALLKRNIIFVFYTNYFLE